MLTIYAVSDSIGETSEMVAKATATQFSEGISVKRVPYIKTQEDVNTFINSIEKPESSMVISTVILVEIREFLVERCVQKGVHIVNVLGPSISTAARIIKTTPNYRPGAVWNMDSEYHKKIEAMEFAMQYDDSKDHSGIKYADVILVGLSRTSKTPLCMYLANKGIKALNIPLMPEVPVPEEVYKIDRRKVIGLTIDPMQLIEIRKHRLSKMKSYASSNKDIQYANAKRVLDELDYAERIMKRLGCKVIDVTKRAIEDTALIIMERIQK